MALLEFDGTPLPDPTVMQWSLERVSSANAGRTQDGIMHVEQIALKRKIELAWNNIPFATATAILKAAKPEYINVKYYDFLEGKNVTKKFYTGEQSIPVYSFKSGIKIVTNVAFNIIEV